MHLAHVPYELCHTVVQLMAAQPPHHDTARLPLASAPSRGRNPADTYHTYLRLALYDTACMALAVGAAYKEHGLAHPLQPLSELPCVEEAVGGMAFVAAAHTMLRSQAPEHPSTSTGTQPGAGGQPPPPATWHDLQQAQAAAVQQAAVLDMLGLPALALRTAVGRGCDVKAQAGAVYPQLSTARATRQDKLDIRVVLDSWGLVSRPWGEQVGNEVAGCVLTSLLFTWQREVTAVVRGGEAAVLLLAALRRGEKLVTPALRPQLPPHLAGRQGVSAE